MSKQEHTYNILGVIATIIVVAVVIGIIIYTFGFFGKVKTDITMNDLKIEVLTEGTGTPAVIGDTVVVNYVGTLADGKEFDNSYKRGQPFPVTIGEGRVIQGWEKGLQGIKVGEKRRLTIPPAMGYGNQDVGGGLIPANSTLIFDIECVEIHPAKK
ncbi:MAG: FKBP-type peptidyl-prolyl cis-trans isomerase [Patescibacteria group bacterium]